LINRGYAKGWLEKVFFSLFKKFSAPSNDEKTERVYFNKEQYFEGISKDVWEYRIGAYQVMEKYLSDCKKESGLSPEEIVHYMRIGVAIRLTVEVQRKVDGVFGKVFEAIG
jgi:hypothetical protein